MPPMMNNARCQCEYCRWSTNKREEDRVTYFNPANEEEDKRRKAGADVPDYCKVCNRPFREHNNGVCHWSTNKPTIKGPSGI
jgi:hypothetical protein